MTESSPLFLIQLLPKLDQNPVDLPQIALDGTDADLDFLGDHVLRDTVDLLRRKMLVALRGNSASTSSTRWASCLPATTRSAEGLFEIAIAVPT